MSNIRRIRRSVYRYKGIAWPRHEKGPNRVAKVAPPPPASHGRRQPIKPQSWIRRTVGRIFSARRSG